MFYRLLFLSCALLIFNGSTNWLDLALLSYKNNVNYTGSERQANE
jgi:hypothetical protein